MQIPASLITYATLDAFFVNGMSATLTGDAAVFCDALVEANGGRGFPTTWNVAATGDTDLCRWFNWACEGHAEVFGSAVRGGVCQCAYTYVSDSDITVRSYWVLLAFGGRYIDRCRLLFWMSKHNLLPEFAPEMV